MNKEDILNELRRVREARENGEKEYSPEEVFQMCEKTIDKFRDLDS
ncbi:MAG: hypothetical protein FWE47_04155 [Oscillospiraceae bacterium]|nr:hypothetical protein [Oscillospiraceae bacterium]